MTLLIGTRAGFLGLAMLFLSACMLKSPEIRSAGLEPAPGRATYETRVDIDPIATLLNAQSTMRYVSDVNTAHQVGLLLNRGLRVRDVRGSAVSSYQSAPFADVPGWTLITVKLDGVSPGSPVSLDIEYSGTPEMPSDGINRLSPDWVELGLDSQWHPIFSTFSQEMVGTLRLGLPPGWQVVASGTWSIEDGMHVIRNRVPQVDVAFSAALAFQTRSLGRTTVYSRQSGPDAVTKVLEAANSCGTDLDRRYGVRDPLPEVKVVLAERPGPGYARKNYIVLSQVNPQDSIALHKFLCHEVAHYWTHSAGAFSADHWMTEAFAEYAAGLYVRRHYGQVAFDSLAASWATVGERSGPIWTPEQTQRPSGAAMYRKAPDLLRRLEARIGGATFDRFFVDYMTKGMETTPELLEHLRAVAGPDAEQWFRDELARGP
jgi:hypothetical protein